METQTKNYRLFLILFAIGMVSGLTLTALSTWADLEAAYYGFSRRASAPLDGFRCPVLMTTGESNVVSLRIKNTTDGKISPSIQVETSSPVAANEFSENLELAPGESAEREWTVGPENVDLKRFIFAKALVYSAYPIPNRETTCGVFILDLPGNGTVIAWAMILLSLLGMGGGLYGVNRAQDRIKEAGEGLNSAQQLMFLSLIILLGLASVFMGSWLFGIVTLVVSLLFILIAAGLLIGRAGR